MKHILLPALLFVANMAFAQFHPSPVSPVSVNPLTVPHNLLVKPDYNKSQSRNNEEFRLDSIVSFKNYVDLDSLKYRISIRTYEGDTNTIVNRNLNVFSGIWENATRERLGFDMAGRNYYYEFSLPESGEFQIYDYQKTFYRFTEGEEKDSAVYYSRDPNSNIFYKEALIDNYTYNANKQETQYERHLYSITGEQTELFRLRSVYDIENRLDSVFYLFGPDTNTLQLYNFLLYTYSGDTTFYVRKDKQPNGAWKVTQRYTLISNALGRPVFIHLENLDASTQQWKTYYKRERTYDQLNRLITLKSTTTGFSGETKIDVIAFGYLNENQYSYAFIYDVDNATGNWILRNKDYYYYTLVSGTESAHSELDHVTIFPNPANDMITVDAENSSVSRVEIYNLSGQLIQSQSSLTGSPAINIRRKGLSAGTYLMKVITNKGTAVREVVFK